MEELLLEYLPILLFLGVAVGLSLAIVVASMIVARQHPEWGSGRVLRWFPAGGGQPPRLRVMFGKIRAPQVLPVTEVDIVGD